MASFSMESALKLIPEFKGEREELHRFISCCNIVSANAISVTHKRQFINLVKCKLIGPAYNFIKYRDFTTWEDLRNTLQEQLLERRTIAQLQTELLSSRQKPNESVREFSNRLERITADLTDACIASEGQAAAGIIENLNSKSCLKAFVEGLLDPLKILIKASRFSTFRDAVENTVEEERIQEQSKAFQNFKSNGYSQGKTQKNYKIQCFKCKKNGHTADKCFSKMPSFPRWEQNTNYANIRIICHYCKKPGHLIKDCYKKQNADKKNINSGSSYLSGNAMSHDASGSVVPARNFK